MRDFLENGKYRKVFIAFVVTFSITVVTFAVIFVAYTQKLKSASEINLSSIDVVDEITEEATETSTSEDKDIEDVLNETLENIEDTEIENTLSQAETSNTLLYETTESEVQVEENDEDVVEETEQVKPVSFIAPASGEIITDYAEDSLIYSETLDEWTTHLGIDIKADKTSVVVAAEDGIVKSIKNDPRYGLTITISHNENFETVYSNLLSTEFISEGDEVTQGQTIATVGESASFEVALVPHLHFEMYKDGEAVNPTIYLN